MSLEDDPRIWRLRAEEARTVGENMTDLSARTMMEQAAVCYDQIADLAERHQSRAAAKGLYPLPI